jgi:hypothetical protein
MCIIIRIWRSMLRRSLLWSNDNAVRILLNKTHWYVVIDIKRMIAQWIFLHHKLYPYSPLTHDLLLHHGPSHVSCTWAPLHTARSPFIPISESCHVTYISIKRWPRWQPLWSANITPTFDFEPSTLAIEQLFPTGRPSGTKPSARLRCITAYLQQLRRAGFGYTTLRATKNDRTKRQIYETAQ